MSLPVDLCAGRSLPCQDIVITVLKRCGLMFHDETAWISHEQ